ncbi:MAG: helix-turn-helix transcriptional regulator [Clostridia bacterium]|nr:helix-turn-helix transcriptional regulator [Clostridia bacterium]
MLAVLADSYVSEREEFQLTRGYQPIDSLFYLLEGSFSFQTEAGSFVATKGDLVIFDHRTLMSRHVLSSLRFLYVKFHQKQEGLFPIRTGRYRVTSLRMQEDLQQLEQLSPHRTPVGLELRNHYFNDLLLCLQGPSEGKDAVTAEMTASSCSRPIAYMKEHLSQGITVREVAEACGCSPSSLEGKFRQVFGTSVYRYFISLRMETAKELLAHTTYTVTEISERLGYDNLFYFCNAFKKTCGMTPTEYRKHNLI